VIKFGMPEARPRQISRALLILWCCVAAVPLSLGAWMWSEGIPLNAAALLLSLRPLAGLAVSAMLLFAIAERRTWARIVLLVLSAYGLLLTVLNALLEFRRIPLLVAIDITIGIATVYALFLLFSRESNAWFRGSDATKPVAGV
jgi:threonine/homoserine efflux transporter RhtA